MESRPGRGRPLKRPSHPLGQLIVDRMAKLNMRCGELAKHLGVSRTTLWRLLQGEVRVISDLRLRTLVAALALEGERRDTFPHLCAEPTMPVSDRVEGSGGTLDHGASQSLLQDCATVSRSELCHFIREQLRAGDWTVTTLARRVGVHPATLSRFLNGHITRTHALNVATLVGALGIRAEANQRRFCELALKADAFALALPAAPGVGRFSMAERRIGMTLEELDHEVERLRLMRTQGELAPAVAGAKRLFNQVFARDRDASALAASPAWTRMKLRVGFEYCEGQAAIRGWYARGPGMVAALDQMEEDLLLAFPMPHKLFASEYGHLLNLRAPLYRYEGDADDLPGAYRRTIAELTRALTEVIPRLDEASLPTELLRNRGHAFLLSGDTTRWKADLLAAERVAQRMGGADSEQFQALVGYSWGEGFKRLATSLHLPPEVKSSHRQDALRALDEGRRVFVRHVAWHGYAILAGIAMAQCLLATEPEEALARATELRALAQRTYPSLADKIERVACKASAILGDTA